MCRTSKTCAPVHWTWLTVIAVVPVLLAGCFYYIYSQQPKLFGRICEEDRLVENAQFFLFLAAGLVGIWLSLLLWETRGFHNAVPYTLFALLCLFIAMEEISWGQRVFEFETPRQMRSLSTQREFNIHNLRPIQGTLFAVYIAVGASACVSAALWLAPGLRSRRWFRFHTVHPALVFYFVPLLAYGLWRLKIGSWSEMRASLSYSEARLMSLIQEPVEMGLALGFLLIALFALLQKRREDAQEAWYRCRTAARSGNKGSDRATAQSAVRGEGEA